jgi:methylsterol monooxygenase
MVRFFFYHSAMLVFNRFNQCYGVIGVLDSIHGTDVMFRKSKSYTRHSLMLTLKPPREAFPDDSNRKMK